MIASRGFPPPRPAVRGPLVVTIGVFDGLHRGHRAILLSTLAAARRVRGTALVLTFDRHPLATLAPGAAPRCLMTLGQRLAGFAALGFRRACVLPFDRPLASLSAEAFVDRILVNRLRVARIVVGYDFHFGRGGRGDAGLLRALGVHRGFTVAVVRPVLAGGEPISSTRVRRLVALGRMPAASRLLGRPFAMAGIHVRGRRLARRLGFPTINLAPANEVRPPHGVYVVRLRAAGETGPGRPGVANFGLRPTVVRNARAPLLEVHVLGRPPAGRPGRSYETDLVRFLRPERRFASLDLLTRAIRRDVGAARRALHLTPLGGRG